MSLSQLFVASHVIMAVGAIVAIWHHIQLLENEKLQDFINCVITAISFWVFDRTIRIARVLLLNVRFGRCSSGYVQNLKSLGVVKITVTVKGPAALYPTTFAPGTHVYLHVPKIQPFSAHPFSISQWTVKDDSVDLVFYAKVHKGLTKQLCSLHDCKTTVLIEGTYGQHHNVSQPSCPNVHNERKLTRLPSSHDSIISCFLPRVLG